MLAVRASQSSRARVRKSTGQIQDCNAQTGTLQTWEGRALSRSFLRLWARPCAGAGRRGPCPREPGLLGPGLGPCPTGRPGPEATAALALPSICYARVMFTLPTPTPCCNEQSKFCENHELSLPGGRFPRGFVSSFCRCWFFFVVPAKVRTAFSSNNVGLVHFSLNVRTCCGCAQKNLPPHPLPQQMSLTQGQSTRSKVP